MSKAQLGKDLMKLGWLYGGFGSMVPRIADVVGVWPSMMNIAAVSLMASTIHNGAKPDSRNLQKRSCLIRSAEPEPHRGFRTNPGLIYRKFDTLKPPARITAARPGLEVGRGHDCVANFPLSIHRIYMQSGMPIFLWWVEWWAEPNCNEPKLKKP
jgi:hypothetical protein